MTDQCPDCGRLKAKCAGDAARGLCPKEWAPRDPLAERDCENHAAQNATTGTDLVDRLRAELDRVTRERDEARNRYQLLKSETGKIIADVSDQFRKVNVDAVISQIGDEIIGLKKRATAAEAAFTRQADNMTFVINNVPLSDQWYEKLKDELEQDRAAIRALGEKAQ